MKRVSDEDRALFLLALSGRIPKRPITKASVTKASAKSAAKLGDKPQNHPRTKAPVKNGARHVSDEELDLFLEAIGKKSKKSSEKQAEVPVVLMPMLPIRPRAPKRGPGGIDGNTKRRLEKGEIAPTAKLDLHGMTESAAHGALMTFLHAAHRRGDRLALIVTGKGPFLDPNGYGGILRQNVPRWLEEAPMAQIIADKRWAHKRHGGDGALYVYFKKR